MNGDSEDLRRMTPPYLDDPGLAYSDPAETMRAQPHPALVAWDERLNELKSLAEAKRHDYGNDGHPFANVMQSEEFKVPAWLGAVIRLNDKVTRIKSFRQNGRLRNESLEDSLLDIANYALIALALLDSGES